MKNLLIKFLLTVIFWYAGDSLQPQVAKNFSTMEIAAIDLRLRFMNGVLWYGTQPFSGVLVENYPNGRVQSKSEYQRGQKHGAEWMWYPTGKMYWKRNYQNGEKHGIHQGWWSNGQTKFLYHFVNGRYEGDAQEWYENGQLAKSQHFAQGVETGEQRAWRENGKLYVNYVMKNGKRYGLFNSRLCYKVKDGQAQY